MNQKTDGLTHLDERAQQVRDAIVEQLSSPTEDQRAFVGRYFANAAPEDLVAHPAARLGAVALSHLEFAQQRQAETPLVRVFYPRFDDEEPDERHIAIEVVTDDMPFLVDSLVMELARQGGRVNLTIHPVLRVTRDAGGQITAVADKADTAEGAHAESFIHLEIECEPVADQLAQLENGVRVALRDIRLSVQDWPKMLGKIGAIVQEIKSSAAPVSIQESEEAVVFMQWLIEENFVFLGYRQYDLLEQEGQDVLNLVPGSGLGILRETDSTRRSSVLPEHVRGYARTPVLLTLTKGNARSTVHRPTHVDYVGVKRFDSDGNVIGEHRFLGLYTSAAYRCDPREIPVVRHKLQHVTARSGLPLGGHSEKALQTILHDYPRDELFQIPQELLYEFALGILHLQERQQIRVFVRMDPFRRFVSCLVFVPRERYNTQLRKRHQKLLQRAFKGTTAEFNTLLSESSLARVHFVIPTDPSEPQDVDVPALEQRLIDAGRTWSEKMFTSLCKRDIAAHDANLLLERYGQAFPAGYREYFKSPDTAARDIGYLEALHEPNDLEMHLYRLEEDLPEIIRLKLFHLAEPLPLSDILPILENLGLRVVTERPFPIWRHDAEMAWIDDFKMTLTRGDELDMDEIGERFHAGLTRIWCGEVESDGFNRLILVAGLTWRQTRVLRACCRYLMQLGVPFSQPYMENTLVNNWQICALLVDYFEARFDPAITDRETRMQECEDKILGMINDVTSLDDDRILRLFLSVMQASLRTNYFHKDADGNPKTVLTLKLSTEKIEAAPQPRPRFEIFVYSPRVEGVHLRGGKVARGGLRWSDRREDFRTEILGLMKAQMVKNAVIVPVGAKGGFVLKRATADREAWKAEGVACYQIFIQALLDITDNLVGGQTVCPADTVRHDEDDPYFVVAADKGTATFSDYANEIAIRNHFWLGDAFASGGSAGYDHKKMGITARGAWESVKRHFRELGIDTQSTPFRVVGIGDMAGDVFGNGMLLSRCIRLVAAFNHMHIFIDPEPDPEVGFNERQRLFDSPNLSWQDYDPQKISAGGGVFLRSAKRINLTPQIKAALDIDADALTPNELIRCILKAPVDLLWNGGIGTFFKSRFQSHADAGDRVNDPIRIDGRELRCRVAGEGGNLGFTQLGRVEFAQHGGHMLTDAIDNSAGVDCSDHEVNIKILLNEIGKSTGMSGDERNALLEEMTEEVAALVLNNNYRQNQAIGITHHHASLHLEAHSRFIRTLEKSGKLDRALEFLPSEEEVAERLSAGTGLTQPELAVLHSYAKITLYEELLHSDVCEDPYLSSELQRYFPKPIRERYASFLDQHPLRREIIATQLTNSIINASGITMIPRFAEQFNYSAPDVTRAYTTAREVFKTPDYRRQVDALDNKVPAQMQIRMLIEAGRLIERATLWFLQNRPQPMDISATVEQFAAGAAEMAETLQTVITPQHAEVLERAVANYEEAGVPRDLAARCSGLGSLFSALDIVEVSRNRHLDVQQTAKTYFQLGHDLELYWLREQLHGLGNDYWQRMATEGLYSDLYRYQRLMTADVITGKSGADMYADWRGRYQREIGRVSSVIAELKDASNLNLAMITVAFREIKALANASLTL